MEFLPILKLVISGICIQRKHVADKADWVELKGAMITTHELGF